MAKQTMKWIDISAELLSAAPAYSDTPAVIHTEAQSEAGGRRSILLCSVHNGTHISAPAAYLEGAKTVDAYAPDRFLGECRVVKAKGALTGSWIDSMGLYRCDKLLIKGEGKGKIDPSAAEALVDSGIKLVGTDAASIGLEPMNAEVRRILAEADCLVLEGLNLEKAEMGTYFLLAQPLLIEGCEAAPCRALLAEDYLYWNR
ncbi:MAG: cyclase family protein [Ruminococcaceae bacterium]|nr:cyclase family protein [Oscillospiraceae bacterium]